MIESHDTATAAMPTPGAGPQMRMVEVALITASLTNPRKSFDQAKLQELADSIRGSGGVHQAVLLRPLPASRLAETFDNRSEGAPLPAYELICGERRLRASRIAEQSEIPAMIRELSDEQALEIQIIENLQRDDLSTLEEAEGYESLMQHSKLNADEVAAKISKSRSYVYGRLKLLDLGEPARAALRHGKIDTSKALLLARIPDHKLQAEACKKMTHESAWDEGVMSYRAAARMVQEDYMVRLDRAKFPIADATLLPDAGSCDTCSKRTGAQPELFKDVSSADVCIDPTCYRAKEAALSARAVEEARAKGQAVITADESKELLHEQGSYYDQKFKGYRRIDNPDDSPTDKPLRKILEKVMKSEGIAPVMIENPRRPGELVACLTNETVSRLLKLAQGQAQAAKVVSKEVKELVDAKAAKTLAKAKARYEAEWRRLLMVRCLSQMQIQGIGAVSRDLHRHLALSKAFNLQTDDAAALCDVLNLGKVSPNSALREFIEETNEPDFVHLLLIAQAESDPNDYDSPHTGRKANQGMHLVLQSIYGPSSDAVLKEVQAEAAALHLPKPEAVQPAAPEGAYTPPPAAHADDSARKGKNRKRPAAPAGDLAGGRVTAAEASANIAAALQAADESNPGAAQAAQGNEPGPVADALGQVGGANQAAADANTGATGDVGPGAKVRINDNVPKQAARFIGKIGTVERVMGDGSCWWVDFSTNDNVKFSGKGSFHITELDLMSAAPEADEAQAEEPAAPAAVAPAAVDLPQADTEAQAEPQTSAAPVFEAGQVVRVKNTTSNKKWRGREVMLMARKTKDLADTDPIWSVRFGTPPKHADSQFFSSDLEVLS